MFSKESLANQTRHKTQVVEKHCQTFCNLMKRNQILTPLWRKTAQVMTYRLREKHSSCCVFTKPIILPLHPVRSASLRMKVTHSQTLCALSVQ